MTEKQTQFFRELHALLAKHNAGFYAIEHPDGYSAIDFWVDSETVPLGASAVSAIEGDYRP